MQGSCPDSLPVILQQQSSLDVILESVADWKPAVMVVDSIQTVVLGDVDGRAGSVLQVRGMGDRFGRCKQRNCWYGSKGDTGAFRTRAGPVILKPVALSTNQVMSHSVT